MCKSKDCAKVQTFLKNLLPPCAGVPETSCHMSRPKLQLTQVLHLTPVHGSTHCHSPLAIAVSRCQSVCTVQPPGGSNIGRCVVAAVKVSSAYHNKTNCPYARHERILGQKIYLHSFLLPTLDATSAHFHSPAAPLPG